MGERSAEIEIGEHIAEIDIGGTLCLERNWRNTLLRDRIVEHCAVSVNVGTQC